MQAVSHTRTQTFHGSLDVHNLDDGRIANAVQCHNAVPGHAQLPLLGKFYRSLHRESNADISPL